MARKQTLVMAWGMGMPCAVLLFFILMICLWEYRVWVGVSLLLLLFVVAGIYTRGQFIEQNLRITRFDHTKETPLDVIGEPAFWRQDMKENVHRLNGHAGSQEPPCQYQGQQQ